MKGREEDELTMMQPLHSLVLAPGANIDGSGELRIDPGKRTTLEQGRESRSVATEEAERESQTVLVIKKEKQKNSRRDQ